MTDPAKLLELAARCEAASGGDREIDVLVWSITKGMTAEWQGNCLVADGHVVGWIDPGEHQRNFSTSRSTHGPESIPAYTASFDAAMALVPDEFERNVFDARGKVQASLESKETLVYSRAATWPLALTAASLRALAAKEGE